MGWRDDTLLTWSWKTVAPAYETLDEAALTAAREQAPLMPPDATLLYAAGDDDLPVKPEGKDGLCELNRQ